MRATRSVLPLALAGALSFSLAACGGSLATNAASPGTTGAPATTAAPPTTAAPATTEAPSSTAAPAPAAPGTIHIKGFAFSPTPLQVTAGQTITIVNGDTTAHTFTADAGGFDSGTIAAGATATVKVAGSGTVGYHCSIHAFMKGALQVA